MKKIIIIIFLMYSVIYSWSWEQYRPETSLIPDNTIMSVKVSPDNIIWMATMKGVVRFDGRSFQVFTKENSNITSNVILDIAIDKTKNPYIVWIATDNGACYYNGRIWYSIRSYENDLKISNVSISGNYVTSIFVDENFGNSVVYFGTENGLCKYDYKNWYKVYLTNKKIFYFIKDIDKTKDGKLLVATQGYGMFVLKNNESILLDKRDGLISENINCFSVSKSNQIYVGTDDGIYLFDGEHTLTKFNSFSSIKDLQINDMEFDVNQRLWMASNIGLIVFDKGEWNIYKQEENGLLSNNLKSITTIDYRYFRKIGIIIGTADKGLSLYKGYKNEKRNLYEQQKQDALKYFAKRNKKKAYLELKKLNSIVRDDIDVLYSLGVLFYEDKYYNNAYYYFTKVLEYKNDHKASYFMLGLIYMNMHLYREAKIQFNVVLDIDENSSESYFYLAKIYIKEKEYLYAIKLFRQVIDLDSTNYEAYWQIIDIYKKLGLNFNAISYLKMLKNLHPKDVSIYIELCKIYFKENILYEAAKQVREALDIDPNSDQAHVFLARILIKGKKYSQAKSHINIALNLNKKNSDAYAVDGEYYKAVKMKDIAVDQWKASKDLDPNNIISSYNLGIYYYRKIKYKEAIDELNIVVEQEPANYVARYYLGLSYQASSLYVLAVEEYKNIKRIFPKYKNMRDIDLRLKALKEFIDVK